MKQNDTFRAVWRVTWRLLAVCLVVTALTALVFEITKGPIESGERTRKENAIRLIFSELDSFTEDKSISGEGVIAVYEVKDADGQLLGFCVDYIGNSDYGGEMNMMVGVSPAGKVIGLQVISHSETFMDRYLDGDGCYTGVNLPRGSDVSAGATLSYNGLRNAIEAIEKLFGGAV